MLTERPTFTAFVTDSESEGVLRRALPDITADSDAVLRGDIGKAIAHLENNRTPTLLLVDIGGTDMPLSKITQLSEVCEPGAHVVAIGNDNDVGLYRNLMRAGVTDYLAKPLTVELVCRAIEAATNQSANIASQQKLGKVIAVLGTRGGAGTTTVAVNLAWHLANRVRRRVALVDLDLQTSDTSLMLDIKATSALREALESSNRIDRVFLERVIAQQSDRFYVLTAEEPLTETVRIEPQSVHKLVSVLQEDYHYIILDVPRNPALLQGALELAALRVIVSDETVRSAREIVRMRGLFAKVPSGENLLVINRAGEKRPGHIAPKDFLRATEMESPINIATVKRFRTRPAEYGQPLAVSDGGFARGIEMLANAISGRPAKRKWWRK